MHPTIIVDPPKHHNWCEFDVMHA